MHDALLAEILDLLEGLAKGQPADYDRADDANKAVITKTMRAGGAKPAGKKKSILKLWRAAVSANKRAARRARGRKDDPSNRYFSAQARQISGIYSRNASKDAR